jgi:hypothetical protein
MWHNVTHQSAGDTTPHPRRTEIKITALLEASHSPTTALWQGHSNAVEVNQYDVTEKKDAT